MSKRSETETLTLGSGKLYIDEFSGTLPENTAIETEEKLLGLIQGGATLEYKPEFYTAEDDFGLVQKTIITKEEVTLKSGLCTWNGNTLAKLCQTARVTDAAGKRTVKIGGKNQAGFSLAFAKDKETVVDAEFKAQPHDSDGTLIRYEEETGNS